MKSILFFIFFLCCSCSIVGIQDVEEPEYEILSTSDEVEIRQYKSYCTAETTVKGSYKDAQSQGFRILAAYIFGDNLAKEKIAMTAPVSRKKESTQIAMTAPVLIAKKEESWIITFTMPAKYNLEDLPKPLDKRISLKKKPAKTLAVLGFSGFATEENVEYYKDHLSRWLKKSSSLYIKMSSAVVAGYNPPWTLPFLRRNEIMYEVRKK
ncbi:MAG: heme-binding protein [Oligoflexales bacterium]